MLKAAWKAKKGEDDQYFCVDDDDDKEEKDWLSDVPAADDNPVSLNDARTADLSLAGLRRILESDAELRIMTGYGREEFGRLYRAFAGRWELVEREEIERRRQYRLERAGKGGPRPAADAYEDYVKNVPLIRDDPLRASNPGNRTAEKFAASGGVIPSHRNSASTYRGGGITKQGSVWMRNAIVEAAATTIRHDERMRKIYERIRKRRGAMKARVAVARHMLEIIWHMLTNGEEYRTQDRRMTERKYKKMENAASTS